MSIDNDGNMEKIENEVLNLAFNIQFDIVCNRRKESQGKSFIMLSKDQLKTWCKYFYDKGYELRNKEKFKKEKQRSFNSFRG